MSDKQQYPRQEPTDAATLKERAKSKVQARAIEPTSLSAQPPETTQQMFHELQAHQMELELQNEELCRARFELDATRTRYFELYDMAPVGYITISEKGLIQETNLKASSILGLARGSLVNERFSRFILNKDEDMYCRLRKQLLESSLPQSCELQMVRSAGTVFWAQLSATLLQGKDGNPVILMTLSDITERKLVEKALAESEEKYRIIFNNEIYAICIFDVETYRFLDINHAFCHLYGYSREKLLSGMTIHDITAEQQASESSTQHSLSEGTIFIPIRYHRKKDGTIIPVEIVGGPYSWKGKKVMFGLIHDISHRLKTEDQLKEIKVFNLAILNSLSAEIAVLDANGEITAVNQAWQRFALENSVNPGIPIPHTEIGTNYLKICTQVGGEEKGDALKAINGIQSVLEGSLLSFCMEYPCHSQDKDRWFSMSVTPLNSKTRGVVVVHTDITEQKRAEMGLIKAQAELEQRVLERTAELEKTNATLVMMLDYARKAEMDIEERVVANLRVNNLQLLDGLRKQQLSPSALDIVELLGENIQNLAHPLTRKLDSLFLRLTPREMQIANFIRQGKTSKDIMQLLGLSFHTLESHRNNLRHKLGLRHKKVNLRAYLISQFEK